MLSTLKLRFEQHSYCWVLYCVTIDISQQRLSAKATQHFTVQFHLRNITMLDLKVP